MGIQNTMKMLSMYDCIIIKFCFETIQNVQNRLVQNNDQYLYFTLKK